MEAPKKSGRAELGWIGPVVKAATTDTNSRSSFWSKKIDKLLWAGQGYFRDFTMAFNGFHLRKLGYENYMTIWWYNWYIHFKLDLQKNLFFFPVSHRQKIRVEHSETRPFFDPKRSYATTCLPRWDCSITCWLYRCPTSISGDSCGGTRGIWDRNFPPRGIRKKCWSSVSGI